jgi:hypothetical protein
MIAGFLAPAFAKEVVKSSPTKLSIKTESAKIDQASEFKNLHLKVVYGEKITDFEVTREKNGGVLQFSNNFGQKKSHSLSEKDVKFLGSEVKKMNESNDIRLCDSRKYIELNSGEKKLIGCIGSSTKTAKKLSELANLFSGIVRL